MYLPTVWPLVQLLLVDTPRSDPVYLPTTATLEGSLLVDMYLPTTIQSVCRYISGNLHK